MEKKELAHRCLSDVGCQNFPFLISYKRSGVNETIIGFVSDSTIRGLIKKKINDQSVFKWLEVDKTNKEKVYHQVMTRNISGAVFSDMRNIYGDKYDEICDLVWEMMSPFARSFHILRKNLMLLEDPIMIERTAAEGYIAHLAQSGVDATFSQKVKKKLRDFRRAFNNHMGYEDVPLNNDDIRVLLSKSAEKFWKQLGPYTIKSPKMDEYILELTGLVNNVLEGNSAEKEIDEFMRKYENK